MAHTVEVISPTRRKLSVTVAADKVNEAFKSALDTVTLSAEIKGFRKGKVPASLVKKFYAQQIHEKAVNGLVESSYSEALKAVDFQVVSYPNVEPVGTFEEGKDFQFVAEVDINPVVDINGYKDLALSLPKSLDQSVDSQVDSILKNLTESFGAWNKVTDRAAALKDRAKVSFTVTADGEEIKEMAANYTLLSLDDELLEGVRNGVVGMTIGSTKTFEAAIPATFHNPLISGKTLNFQLTLHSLEALSPAALDDALAQKVGSENVDALRTLTLQTATKGNEDARLNALREQVLDKILAANAFEVPESLVEAQVDRLIDEANRVSRSLEKALDPKNEDVRASFKDKATREVRGVLALGHIARQEGVTVEDSEAFEELRTFCVQNRISPQQLFNQAGTQVLEEFRGRVLIRKVLKHVVGLSKVEVQG